MVRGERHRRAGSTRTVRLDELTRRVLSGPATPAGAADSTPYFSAPELDDRSPSRDRCIDARPRFETGSANRLRTEENERAETYPTNDTPRARADRRANATKATPGVLPASGCAQHRATGRLLQPAARALTPDGGRSGTVGRGRNPDFLARDLGNTPTPPRSSCLDKKPVMIGHRPGLAGPDVSGRASRRPRWRSTPGSSAAFCRCRARSSRGWARSGQPAHAPARASRSVRPSGRPGLTRWTKGAKELYDTFTSRLRDLSRPDWHATQPLDRGQVNTKTRPGPCLITTAKGHTFSGGDRERRLKRQRATGSENVKIPNRGPLTIDHAGQVAETALPFVKRSLSMLAPSPVVLDGLQRSSRHSTPPFLYRSDPRRGPQGLDDVQAARRQAPVHGPLDHLPNRGRRRARADLPSPDAAGRYR